MDNNYKLIKNKLTIKILIIFLKNNHKKINPNPIKIKI